jgi:hypothetical protein
MLRLAQGPAQHTVQTASLHWFLLSQSDRSQYLELQASFAGSQQRICPPNQRAPQFAQDLAAIVGFINSGSAGAEDRAILAGVAFAGRYICVNTRQLQKFLCRCKSTINACFQKLGYCAVKQRGRARQCVVQLLPSMANETSSLRQWGVRYATENATLCFCSRLGPSLALLPQLDAEDLDLQEKCGPLDQTVEFPIRKELIGPMPIPPPSEPWSLEAFFDTSEGPMFDIFMFY